LDIYTEESIEKINKNKKILDERNKMNKCKCDKTRNDEDKQDYYNKKYKVKYNYKKTENLRNEILESLPAHPTQIEYFNGIRAESIRRIKQLRNEVIEKVRRSTSLAKCNPSQLTPQELEDLRARVFANSRFCFLIDFTREGSKNDCEGYSTRIISMNNNISAQHFELITVFNDFYLSKNQVEKIKYISLNCFLIIGT
jgi:hypothetical protein